MSSGFRNLFTSVFPIIGCVHLGPLPGSPRFDNQLSTVFEKALGDASALAEGGVDGLIIENFNDNPFYRSQVPPETVASMAVIADRIKTVHNLPTGINVLRNDANSALGIAAATHADFIRVNIHMHAMVTDQGIIEGRSFETLRTRSRICPGVLIFADVNVKHATPLAEPDVGQWVEDLTKRGMADALIVSGSGTGKAADLSELEAVRHHTDGPILIGSGTNPTNIRSYAEIADGAIVGSYLKYDGIVSNPVDPDRTKDLIRGLN